jgi:hypothetical protein
MGMSMEGSMREVGWIVLVIGGNNHTLTLKGALHLFRFPIATRLRQACLNVDKPFLKAWP